MATDIKEVKSFSTAKDEKRKAAIFICNAGAGIADDDYSTQDTEIEKLCTHRIMEGFVESPNGSLKIFTLSGADFDSRIKPVLYVGGSPKHADDGTYAYTYVASTGVFTFTTAPTTGTVLKATVDGRLSALTAVDIPGVTIDIKQEDISAIGATASVESLRTIGASTFSDASVTIMPNANVDPKRQAEPYPGHNFQCLFYGLSQWPNNDTVRELGMNSNPAVMRIVFYDEADSTTSGDIKYKEYRVYGLKFKGFSVNALDATNKALTEKWVLSVKNIMVKLAKVS